MKTIVINKIIGTKNNNFFFFSNRRLKLNLINQNYYYINCLVNMPMCIYKKKGISVQHYY